MSFADDDDDRQQPVKSSVNPRRTTARSKSPPRSTSLTGLSFAPSSPVSSADDYPPPVTVGAVVHFPPSSLRAQATSAGSYVSRSASLGRRVRIAAPPPPSSARVPTARQPFVEGAEHLFVFQQPTGGHEGQQRQYQAGLPATMALPSAIVGVTDGLFMPGTFNTTTTARQQVPVCEPAFCGQYLSFKL